MNKWRMVLLGCFGLIGSSVMAAESYLMRFPDICGDKIVFTYEGDLWLVSATGGEARRITNDNGEERFAKFSPDGSLLAFTAGYDGGTDVYVMEATGGVPRRLTYHPAVDGVLGWFPDGKSILFRSRREYPSRGEQVYRVSVNGGQEQKLPVDRAGLSSISPDGKQIAYNRISTEYRTWKRYQGGMAQDIWMGNLETGDFKKITDWPGTDGFPMWQGDFIYFISDRKNGTQNLYKYEVKSGTITQLTDYRDYDIKNPSIGPGAIVYQYAESLYVFDLKAGAARKVEITIPTDLVKMRAGYVDVAAHVGSYRLSPSGTRMLLESRGEIINVPVKQGEPINLTNTSGSREKCAAWSPDGRWIAFLSDKTGEEEIYLVDQKAEQPWRQLTQGGKGWRGQLVWSPDSKWLLFCDKFMKLNLVNAENGEISVIDQGEYDDTWERWGIQEYSWSPDSRWVTYVKMVRNLNQVIYLYSLADKKVYPLTDDQTSSWSPSFDPQGRYLYLLSERTYTPTMSFVDQQYVLQDMCRPYVVLLKADAVSPFAPSDSDEPIKAGEDSATRPAAKSEDKKADEGADSKAKAVKVHIDIGDFDRRMIAAEGIPAGNYFRLEATDKGIVYLKKEGRSFTKYQWVLETSGDSLDLYGYELDQKDPEKRQAKKLMTGINNYHQSADGKKLIYRQGGTFGVVEVGSSATAGEGKVSLDGVKIKIDRAAEFAQMFNEAWRIERDWFYDPNLHRVDWQAVGGMYGKFVPFCGNRSDLNYLIGEMIGELNAGHTYVSGGDFRDDSKRIPTALLGAEFDTPAKAAFHRFRHIVPGNTWDPDESSPLGQPGCPIKEGDYLIAVNDRPVPATDNVYQHLENLSGRVVTLTYNSKPVAEGAKTYRTRTIGSEDAIRYREWVDTNRRKVDQTSGGKIGYVHIPNMGEEGCIEFSKAWYHQYTRTGMIVDVRYNGGGFTGDMLLDQIERKLWGITQPREGKTVRDPEKVFHGHIVVLINEDTGSNGEYFSEAVKIKGLGTVIGMRTWGGAVGIEPHQDLVDGGSTTPPQFAPFGFNRQWLIEGHGVVPDIEVQNMPGDVIKGKDAQLEAGISLLLEKLAKDPAKLPETPEFLDRAKKVD